MVPVWIEKPRQSRRKTAQLKEGEEQDDWTTLASSHPMVRCSGGTLAFMPRDVSSKPREGRPTPVRQILARAQEATDGHMREIARALGRHAAREHYAKACSEARKDSDSE